MIRRPLTTLRRFRQRRPLTAAEYAWAVEVFGATLPARERIRLSPALGPHRRAFTFPGPRATVTIHLGPAAADPLGTDPTLFAHELTHVWQIHHARHLGHWLARAVVTQVRFSLGRDVYGIGDGSAPWRSYGLEQQATVVERWVADRDGPEGRRLQHHLDDDVRAAGPG